MIGLLDFSPVAECQRLRGFRRRSAIKREVQRRPSAPRSGAELHGSAAEGEAKEASGLEPPARGRRNATLEAASSRLAEKPGRPVKAREGGELSASPSRAVA